MNDTLHDLRLGDQENFCTLTLHEALLERHHRNTKFTLELKQDTTQITVLNCCINTFRTLLHTKNTHDEIIERIIFRQPKCLDEK